MKLQSPCLNIWKKNFPEYFSRTNYEDSIRNFIKQLTHSKIFFKDFVEVFKTLAFQSNLEPVYAT